MKKELILKPMIQALLVTGMTAGATFRSAAVVQTSSEVWVGSTSTIQGSGTNGPTMSFFSQRMILPLETAGTLSGVLGATLTDTNCTWTDGQFGTNGVAAYVEFDNGWMADIADCSAANHSLTLAGSLGGAVSVGNAYRVHKHFTVATMFGANNEAGLKSGLNLSSADNIQLLVPETQRISIIYYYDDGLGGHGWYHANGTRADNQVINPEQGVMVYRRAAADLGLSLVGPVKTGVTVATIDPGYNLVGTLKSATAMPLSGLNLYTGDPATGFAGGFNLSAGDNLVVIRPDGTPKLYFYYADPFLQTWMDTANNNANAVQIAPGSAFFVWRKARNTAFNWTIPAE